MKVLIADKFEKSGIEGLKGLGCEVISNPDLKDEALGEALRETQADILVVRSTKVNADMLKGTHLALIIRAGAGVNTIDVKAASENGVLVANCPGKNSQAVAELAFGLMIACDRFIADNVIELKNGHWDKKRFSKGKGLCGRTLGLIGMGKIGQEMVTRAHAFGMNVVAFSRWMTADVAAALGVGRAESIAEVAKQADVVSVHVALTPETKGLLGDEFFGQMKEGAIFINTSRAEVVQQAALEKVLKAGKIVAGLDVFEGEPSVGEGPYEGPMRDMPGCYCTHHIGASTEQAQEAIASETVRIVKEYRATGIAPNVVNVTSGGHASNLLVVRHLDRVGVLAHVLSVLKEEGVNVQEMENIILGNAQAAIAQIAVDKVVSAPAIDKIRMNEHVLDASLIAVPS